MKNALLINYQYCSGCHSCEIACKNEHSLKLNEWGIKLTEVSPFELDDGTFEWIYQPVPTKLCDLCANRVVSGKDPACVHHCLAFCIEYGTLEEMTRRAEEMGGRVSIYLP